MPRGRLRAPGGTHIPYDGKLHAAVAGSWRQEVTNQTAGKVDTADEFWQLCWHSLGGSEFPEYLTSLAISGP
jgi:hypothetical protein